MTRHIFDTRELLESLVEAMAQRAELRASPDFARDIRASKVQIVRLLMGTTPDGLTLINFLVEEMRHYADNPNGATLPGKAREWADRLDTLTK